VNSSGIRALISLPVFACCCVLWVSGCSSSPRFTGRTGEYLPPPPEPSAYRSYYYRATTDSCNCEDFQSADRTDSIGYHLHASYRMDNGIQTDITVELTNNSRDTLFFDAASAKVVSRNIRYMYNDKFLPIPLTLIAPGASNTFHLSGEDRTGENDWHKIAGEQMTVLIQGLHAGLREVAPLTVTFIPQNPMLEK
jgi:hypothetical protein